ncbi:hypothetical protein [Hymenobacter cellulosivorans]|uniref:Uncharacterized protein n=1 Tax=Hymenobacter cellulosivorans TaxID=2932249 RepID=A0ABY4FG18_9BACT|nr:hypothetical protein [Hymenobacter cellulosivorans]UOQ53381.1 hypothetical protein MUN80_01155 [Hymenobacter cellulosivorans]
MIYILWSFLNLTAYLVLLYLFLQATNLIRQHFSLGTALLFFFGLAAIYSSMSLNSQASSAPNLLSGASPDAPVGNGSAVKEISLESNTLSLVAEYYKQDSVIRPRGLYAAIAGLTLGHRWQPSAGSLTQHGNQLRYQLTMVHDWRLLGNTIYISPPLVLTGTMSKLSQ